MDIEFQYNYLSVHLLRKFFLKRLINAKATWILSPLLMILYVIFFLETFNLYSLVSYVVFFSIPAVISFMVWRVCDQWSLAILKQEKNKTYYLNANGVGYKKPGVNYFLEWAFVDSIEETETLIQIRKDNQLEIFFYKFAIEKELLRKVENTLKNDLPKLTCHAGLDPASSR